MSEGIDGVFVGVVDEVCWAEGFVRIFVLGLLRPMWKKDIQRIFKYYSSILQNTLQHVTRLNSVLLSEVSPRTGTAYRFGGASDAKYPDTPCLQPPCHIHQNLLNIPPILQKQPSLWRMLCFQNGWTPSCTNRWQKFKHLHRESRNLTTRWNESCCKRYRLTFNKGLPPPLFAFT